MGGLPRRSTVIAELQQDDTPLFVLDAGGFAYQSRRVPAQQRTQQRRKTTLVLDAFVHDRVDALTVGPHDLAVGREWLQNALTERKLPVTVANLTCSGDAPFPAHQLVQKNGVTIGVVGVIGERTTIEGCDVSAPAEAIRAALSSLKEADLLVVLSQQSDAEDTDLAEAVPEIDLIVNGLARLSREEPRALANNAVQLGAGPKGKKLGIARIGLVEGGQGFAALGALEELEKRKVRFTDRLESAKRNVEAATEPRARRRAESQIDYYTTELAEIDERISAMKDASGTPKHALNNKLRPLDRKVSDHSEVAALLSAAKQDIEEIEANADVAALEGSPYVGSAACAGCHKAIHDQWAKTPHAQAWLSLTAENRAMDQACYSCHVTGAFDPTGPQHPKQVTAALQGVGCESCHGAGVAHVKNPVQVDMVKNPPMNTCTQCHDGEQDQGRFDYATYLPKVNHSDVRTGD